MNGNRNFIDDIMNGDDKRKPAIDNRLIPTPADNIYEQRYLGDKSIMVSCLLCDGRAISPGVVNGGKILYWVLADSGLVCYYAYCKCKVGRFMQEQMLAIGMRAVSYFSLPEEWTFKAANNSEEIYWFNCMRKAKLLQTLGTPDRALEQIIRDKSTMSEEQFLSHNIQRVIDRCNKMDGGGRTKNESNKDTIFDTEAPPSTEQIGGGDLLSGQDDAPNEIIRPAPADDLLPF